jgi:RNA polymerase sigma-70 factor (ECF subfamily)
MHERAERLAGPFVTANREIEHEFESRLGDSATLAFRVAYSVLRHREDAEDVTQEAFAKAYRRFGQLRDRDRFRAWIVRITWRMALDRHRSIRRRFARETVEAGLETRRETGHDTRQEQGADDILAARERADRLWAAIEALPEKLRLVVVLAGIEGHDLKEVGALLNVPEGTVKSRFFLARKQLKERLSWMATNTTR